MLPSRSFTQWHLNRKRVISFAHSHVSPHDTFYGPDVLKRTIFNLISLWTMSFHNVVKKRGYYCRSKRQTFILFDWYTTTIYKCETVGLLLFKRLINFNGIRLCHNWYIGLTSSILAFIPIISLLGCASEPKICYN